jgi:predicted MPP superfamily phosphohydrolase/membrane-associated phospholipid phosphatase
MRVHRIARMAGDLRAPPVIAVEWTTRAGRAAAPPPPSPPCEMPDWIPEFLFRPEPVVWVQRFFGAGHAEWFRVISQLGTTWGILLAMGVALWIWGRRDPYALLGILLVEAAITLLLNQVIHIPRPDAAVIVPYERVAVGSFPSGHVFVATVLWGLLYARGRIRGALLALVLAGVGVARLYLGVHYLMDVLAAVVLGLAVVAAYHALWKASEDRLADLPYAVYLTMGLVAIAGAMAGVFIGFYGSNSFRWHAGGLVAGGAAALLLEHRYIRFTPKAGGAARALLKICIGVIPILLLAWYDRTTGEDDLQLGALLVAAGALWALLSAPAILVGFGLSLERLAGRRAAAWSAARTALIAVLGFGVAVVVYGAGIEPRLILDVEAERVPIPSLPPEWDGRRIAVAGDLQVGMWWQNTGMMRRVVRRIVDERPAAVLLTGDFIYHAGDRPSDEIEMVIEILRPLAESGIPTFAVLGNHDWGMRTRTDSTRSREAARLLESSLRRLGIRVLRNEAVPLRNRAGDEPLYVVGIGSRWAGLDEPTRAFARVPEGAPRVAFMHHPDSFAKIPAASAPLAVAGHTHGGQVRIPFTPDWSWLTFTTDDEVHADGWIDGFGRRGNRLYVNRGVGMSLLPVRIACPPELTLFTLRVGDGGRG